jgi:hypothetical protein
MKTPGRRVPVFGPLVDEHTALGWFRMAYVTHQGRDKGSKGFYGEHVTNLAGNWQT